MTALKDSPKKKGVPGDEIKGSLARRLHNNTVDMAASLGSGTAITEYRQSLLKNFFQMAKEVNALETKEPAGTGT